MMGSAVDELPHRCLSTPLIAQASDRRGRPAGILRRRPPSTFRGQVRFDASEEEATALE